MKNSTTSQRKEDPSCFYKRNISGRKTGLGKLDYHSYLNQWFLYALQTFLYEQP